MSSNLQTTRAGISKLSSSKLPLAASFFQLTDPKRIASLAHPRFVWCRSTSFRKKRFSPSRRTRVLMKIQFRFRRIMNLRRAALGSFEGWFRCPWPRRYEFLGGAGRSRGSEELASLARGTAGGPHAAARNVYGAPGW
jgi:hypothetical protein